MEYNLDNTHINEQEEATGTLEDLKVQMQSLRKRLDAQQIISDSLLRSAVKKSGDYSRRMIKIQIYALMPIGVLSMLFLYFNVGLPLWFVLLTCVYFVVCMFVDLHVQSLTDINYGTTPLLDIQYRLTRQKKLRAKRMLAGMIFLPFWLAIFGYILFNDIHPTSIESGDIEEFRNAMIVGGVIGGIIGLIYGIRTYRRVQRENEDSINLLSEYMDNEQETEYAKQ